MIEKLSNIDNNTPGQNSRKLVKHQLKHLLKPKLSGFIGIYAGYWDYSDTDGLLSFPLRHPTPKVYIAITPQIALINVKGNTYSHKEFVPNVPARLYLFEKKVDAKKIPYWQVSEAKIPENLKINAITIVILNKPDNIFVQLGDIKSNENVQLVLPELYVVGNIDHEKIILNNLDMERFFEQINTDKKQVSDSAVQKMISNL